jgi:2-haloacid dehalogenase
MHALDEILKRATTITFDCYGTLIDWSAGLRKSFAAVFGDSVANRQDELVRAYVEIETEVEAEPYQSYREVLAKTTERLAHRFELTLPPGGANMLAELLPTWKPFADTNYALARLKKRYRLGVLSNIDRDLFQMTSPHFDITFDVIISAEDVRSYKPALGHFARLIEDYTDGGSVLHVAQSLMHDGVPTGVLDIAYVWINRYNDKNTLSVEPVATFADLRSLADRACMVQGLG